MNQIEQIAAAQAYAKGLLGHDQSGHGLDHLRRVARLAQRLAKEEGVDPFIPVVASYLHDTIDEKLFADAQTAQARTREWLSDHDFTTEQVTEIMAIITQMSFAKTLGGQRPTLSIEGQIVQDADWLDAIGAIGIARAIYYGGKHHQVIYDPAIKPREKMDHDEYRNLDHETIINHFYEKLFKIAPMLNTPSAQRIAQQRQAMMQSFVDQFLAEWDGEA